MEPFTTLTSRVVLLPVDNIDTDQIIPARFLTGTQKTGLGAHLFEDWRYAPDGSPRPEFALNLPDAQGAAFLLAGANFGCGSSREHAPWALTDYGIRAVIAPSFADIFRNNALKNGLLPVALEAPAFSLLFDHLTREPETAVTVDLAGQVVVLPGGASLPFPIDAFSRTCLLRGAGELEYLFSFARRIAEYERRQSGR
jgi:3-isopropylmalate/(R)-2-methylmalate dehydratase small subunit